MLYIYVADNIHQVLDYDSEKKSDKLCHKMLTLNEVQQRPTIDMDADYGKNGGKLVVKSCNFQIFIIFLYHCIYFRFLGQGQRSDAEGNKSLKHNVYSDLNN